MWGILALLAAAGTGFALYARRAVNKEAPPTVEQIPLLQPPKLLDFRPRGIRNNNPTNIIDVGIPWRGLAGKDGPFCVFQTANDGLRAGFVNLHTAMNTHGANTLRKIATRWAPMHENDTAAYWTALSRFTGLGIDQVLSYSLHARAIIPAIVRQENGQNPYTVAQFDQAYREAGK